MLVEKSLQSAEARHVDECRRKVRSRGRSPCTQLLDGEPDSEHPESVEDLPPRLVGHARYARLREPIGREQQILDLRRWKGGERSQCGRFVLLQRQPRLGRQTGHRERGEAECLQPLFGAITSRDPRRRLQRVEATCSDLVGSREHGDRVHRRGVDEGTVLERLEEIRVAAVEVSQEVDDGVGVTWSFVFDGEELSGPRRRLIVERGETRSIDQGYPAQC